MESRMQISSSFVSPFISTSKLFLSNEFSNGFLVNRVQPLKKICFVSPNGCVSCAASPVPESNSVEKIHKRRSSLESLFCYDKPIPEERIEKPVGLSLVESVIRDNP